MSRAVHVFVPIAALIAGLLSAVGISSRFLTLDASVRQATETFEELDDREQQELKRYAQQYRDENDLARLSDLHAAVTADAELQQKLTKFNAWFATLDQQRRNELRPSGEFPENWDQLVSDRYHEDQTRVDEITIFLGDTPAGPRFTVTEHEYSAFIDEIIADLPPETQAELNGYESNTAVMLAKCTWISQGVFGGRDYDVSRMFRSIDGVYRRVYSHLLGYGYTTNPDTGREESARSMVIAWEDGSRSKGAILVWRVMHSGMTHFGEQLTEEAPRPDETELLDVLGAMPRDEQVRMFADIPTARHQMELAAIRESEGEKAQALLEEYDIFLQKLEDARRRMMRTRPSYRGKSRKPPIR